MKETVWFNDVDEMRGSLRAETNGKEYKPILADKELKKQKKTSKKEKKKDD